MDTGALPIHPYRAIMAAVIVGLLLPVGVAGLTYTTTTTTDPAAVTDGDREVVFITFQGKWTPPSRGGVVAIDRETKKILWTHDTYQNYFDVDPINDTHILVVTGSTNLKDGRPRYATVIDWVNDTVEARFHVGFAVHDVDYLGDGQYAVGDLGNDSAYVYDRPEDRITWEYRFREHFGPDDGGGEGGYTHLNDIDAVDNGSAFLLSPRNFDRVLLVDRETKTIEFVLGQEDTPRILDRQHNPVLLQRDPPVLLVADSANHRIIEYHATTAAAEEWTAVWSYEGDLRYPRDADRLPNGNTLVVDTGHSRALVVSPAKNIVWEVTLPEYLNTYDAEIRHLGDEPAGPPLSVGSGGRGVADTATAGLAAELTDVYDALQFHFGWILPVWVTGSELAFLLAAAVLAVGWAVVETGLRYSEQVERVVAHAYETGVWAGAILGGTAIATGVVAMLLTVNPAHPAGRFLGLGWIGVTAGVRAIRRVAHRGTTPTARRFAMALIGPALALRVGCVALGGVVAAIGLRAARPAITIEYLSLAIVLGLLAIGGRVTDAQGTLEEKAD